MNKFPGNAIARAKRERKKNKPKLFMSEIEFGNSVKRSKIEAEANIEKGRPCPWKIIRENADKFDRVQGTNSKNAFVRLRDVRNFETAIVWALENGYHTLSIELCKSHPIENGTRNTSFYGHRIRWLALKNGPLELVPLLESYFNSNSDNTISIFSVLDRCDQERGILAMKSLTCKNHLPRVLLEKDMQHLILNCPKLAGHYLRLLFTIYITESSFWKEMWHGTGWIRERVEKAREYKKDAICEWLADIYGKKREISLLLLCARKYAIGSVWSESILPLDLFKRIFEDCGLFLPMNDVK